MSIQGEQATCPLYVGKQSWSQSLLAGYDNDRSRPPLLRPLARNWPDCPFCPLFPNPARHIIFPHLINVKQKGSHASSNVRCLSRSHKACAAFSGSSFSGLWRETERLPTILLSPVTNARTLTVERWGLDNHHLPRSRLVHTSASRQHQPSTYQNKFLLCHQHILLCSLIQKAI